MRLARIIDLGLGRVAAALTVVYRFVYSRWMPPVCCFQPTCSVYAALAWTRHGLFGGMALVRARLKRCTGGPYAGEDWPPGVAPRPLREDRGPRIVTEGELRELELRGRGSRLTQHKPEGVHR